MEQSDPLMSLNSEIIMNIILAFIMQRPDISYAPVFMIE